MPGPAADASRRVTGHRESSPPRLPPHDAGIVALKNSWRAGGYQNHRKGARESFLLHQGGPACLGVGT